MLSVHRTHELPSNNKQRRKINCTEFIVHLAYFMFKSPRIVISSFPYIFFLLEWFGIYFWLWSNFLWSYSSYNYIYKFTSYIHNNNKTHNIKWYKLVVHGYMFRPHCSHLQANLYRSNTFNVLTVWDPIVCTNYTHYGIPYCTHIEGTRSV